MTIRYILASLIIFSMFPSFSHAEMGYGSEEFDLELIFKNFESSQSCNCVVFRLDDIQGYWLNEVQVSIIETLHGKKVPVTIGIVGSENAQFGIDPKITNFVMEKTNAENSLIEIANHGWEHETFPTFDRKTQSDLIKKANDRISKLLGISPKIFIPPLNEFNNDTMAVLEKNGITHFSSELELSKPPFPFHGLTVYNFPETATTGKWNRELGMFEKVDREETFEYINKSLDSFGYAVVTMHPQEFSILEDGTYSNQPDFDKLLDLELLIDDIQRSGLKTVFLSQINENVIENKITIPAWVMNNAGWWAKGQIEDTEFIQGIQYLIKQNIIHISQTSQETDTSSSEIPSWIKSNAEWWAQELISDDDFVKGIQYLVENGIIKLPSSEESFCSGDALCVTTKIERIMDGDTIYIEGYKVRLSLTNTPERNELGFSEATEFTKKLCPVGSVVTVDQDDKQPYDVYNRLLGKVYCEDKILNSELLLNGHANILTQYCSTSEFAEEKWAKEFGCAIKYHETIPPETQESSKSTATPKENSCDASYPDVCIPSLPPDLDCGEISYKNFTVLPPDPHRFDGDKDGIGCEK